MLPQVLLHPRFWGSPGFAPQKKEEGDNQQGSRDEFICNEMLPCTLGAGHCVSPHPWQGGTSLCPAVPHHHRWGSTGPDFSPTLTHFTADVLQSRALQVNLIHFVSLTGDQGGKK